MIKQLHLFSLFLFGCIASSLVAWLGALHPALIVPMRVLYIFVAVGWASCWILDDTLSQYFKFEHRDYYAGLIGFAVAVVLGGVTQWLTNG